MHRNWQFAGQALLNRVARRRSRRIAFSSSGPTADAGKDVNLYIAVGSPYRARP
jgi:hypothetical protein